MTGVNVNNFVPRSDPEYILAESEGYEITIKKLENKNVAKFHCGHTQFMKIVSDFGLVPKWTRWESRIDPQTGKAIAGQGKYVAI